MDRTAGRHALNVPARRFVSAESSSFAGGDAARYVVGQVG